MTAITSINNAFPAEISSPPTSSSWTDVKIQRLWRSTVGILATIASLVCTTFVFIQPLTLIGTIGFGLLAASFFRSTSHLFDFEDPIELAQIQKAAAKMPLSQIVQKYSWKSLFRYEILSPKLWKEKFLNETSKMRCSEIAAFYPIEKLYSYEIISEKSYHILEEAKQTEALFKEQKEALEKEFQERTETPRTLLNMKENALKRKYETSSLQSEINDLYCYIPNTQRHPFFSAIHTLERQIDRLKKMLDADLEIARAEFAISTRPIRSEIDHKIESCNTQLQKQLADLDNLLKRPCDFVDLR